MNRNLRLGIFLLKQIKSNIHFEYASTRFFCNPKLVNPEETIISHPLSDPDKFGTISLHGRIQPKPVDPEDLADEEKTNFKPSGRKLTTKEYADIIKGFIRSRKIKEAIDVLEQRMLKDDRVKPENYIYSLLIGACGRVGYTKKAFMLFNDMKKRGLQVHPGAYTALFNACANSPWKDDGLTRAKNLLNLIKEKNYQPNDTNYHAMIKAFGRLGDLPTVFSLVDEMVMKKLPLTTATFNMIFQACISDKEQGFKYSLLVWRKMLSKNIKPDIYSFNLMLQTVRDCDLGDTSDLIETIKSLNPKSISASDQLRLSSENNTGGSTKIDINSIQENRPNLLMKVPQFGDIIAIKDVKTAQDRLLLLGGFTGVLKEMKSVHVEPDVKTFTQLIDCIPSTLTAEKALLKEMTNINPDIAFFNMLMKKRSMRFDHDNARQVLEMIEDFGLQPDLITYGILAIGCRNTSEADKFFDILTEAGYRINTEILGAMLQQACYRNDFSYILHLMEKAKVDKIAANKAFMDRLVAFQRKCSDLVKNKNNEKFTKSKYFQKGFEAFNLRFKSWKNEIVLDKTDNEHPWSQFREENETNADNYKDKSVHFEPKYASKFKVKTSTKIRY